MFPPSRIVCLTEETVETLSQYSAHGRHGYTNRHQHKPRNDPLSLRVDVGDRRKAKCLKNGLVMPATDHGLELQAGIADRDESDEQCCKEPRTGPEFCLFL